MGILHRSKWKKYLRLKSADQIKVKVRWEYQNKRLSTVLFARERIPVWDSELLSNSN
jgi:hypothetical protein